MDEEKMMTFGEERKKREWPEAGGMRRLKIES